MKLFQSILQKIISEELTPDQVVQEYKARFSEYASKVVFGSIKPDDSELEAFLKCCLDVYANSENGDVLVPDSIYDLCMNVYRSGGHETIVYADPIGKKWDLVPHKIPGVVGTISKVYSYKEFKSWLNHYYGVQKFVISPKYDGVSADIEVEDGKVVRAATRYDGVQGQDITALILKARNRGQWLFNDENHANGHYKCELCVSTEAFEELQEEKKYSNRRSATSGIVNTPSNLNLAKYVTVIPLVWYNPKNRDMEYIAPFSRVIDYLTPADLFESVEGLLHAVKIRQFQFRVDGVVISPARKYLGDPNEMDLMDDSIAYKINTMEGRTRIEYGYMSVGRTGRAMPCLKVEPVEVNETIVTDVSLGSYEKFLSMGLREHEEVIIYSAGDVIPQIKLPEDRTNFDNAEDLKIDRTCPYCGEKLERINTEYYCMNPKCIRVITGRIINFLDKMGMEGFSDKSIETLYLGGKADSIADVLELTESEIESVEGFGAVDARNFIEQINKIKNTPTTIAKFFGSLGIDKISEKKCKKIFENITVDELFHPKKPENVFYILQCADGIGEKTAEIFCKFIDDNKKQIQHLMNFFKFDTEESYKGIICFTGIRPSEEVTKRLHELGYDTSDGGVTKDTIALVAANPNGTSTKIMNAKKKGVPIYPASNLQYLYDDLARA